MKIFYKGKDISTLVKKLHGAVHDFRWQEN